MRFLSTLFSLFFILFLLSAESRAQDADAKEKKELKLEGSVSLKGIEKKSGSKKMSKAVSDLEMALKENDEQKIAKNYEVLAKSFIDKGDYPKGEEYLKKALKSYTKLKLSEDIARVTRGLAQVQESQNKYGEAIKNYLGASRVASGNYITFDAVNQNDAKRLMNASNPGVQSEYVNSNIEILEKADTKDQLYKDEVVVAYKQQAEVNLRQENREVAIESYEKAISYVKNKPEEVIKIKSEIAKVYISDNQLDKAIKINEKLLNEAKIQQDFDTEIIQLQSLADIYFEKKEADKAIPLLKEAYTLALEKGKTSEVKKSISQLLEYYKKNKKDKESIALYEQFLQNFEGLIHADSSLIDAKAFQITEEKIRQLEKEKELKDELITKKNTFNYFLIGSILLLLLFFGLLIKSFFSIKTKNKEIALQSLRREMNPHFIFNSLNSVNQFISQNRELEANKYLTSYSHLMRNMMENSNKDFVILGNEIEQLKKYLDLEHLRFEDQFEYKISVDEELDTESTFIPNMIIQPHLENAIWHGLRYKEEKGFLELRFQLKDGKVNVIIDDNGIGLTQSQNLKTRNQKVHQSRGLTNTKERISLLNELYKKEIVFRITEKKLPETGTIVEISFPLIDKL